MPSPPASPTPTPPRRRPPPTSSTSSTSGKRLALLLLWLLAFGLGLDAGGASATTFDNFDPHRGATAGVTFTHANLTAQGICGSTLTTWGVAPAREGKTAGKWYVEFTIVAVSGNNDGVGILDARGLLGLGFIGQTSISSSIAGTSGYGYYENNHVVFGGASQTAVNNVTYTADDVIGLAIDLDNHRLWWTKNGGAWVGASGTPNPATNTGGFDISGEQSQGRIYPAVDMAGSAAKFTANFGASAFTGTVPSGFTGGWTNTTLGTYFGTFATTGNAGQNTNAPPQNDKAVAKYTATLTGPITSVIMPFGGTGATDLKLVIYDATGAGGLPGAQLFVGANQATSFGGEVTFPVTGVSVVSGTTYWPEHGVRRLARRHRRQQHHADPAAEQGHRLQQRHLREPDQPVRRIPQHVELSLPNADLRRRCRRRRQPAQPDRSGTVRLVNLSQGAYALGHDRRGRRHLRDVSGAAPVAARAAPGAGGGGGRRAGGVGELRDLRSGVSRPLLVAGVRRLVHPGPQRLAHRGQRPERDPRRADLAAGGHDRPDRDRCAAVGRAAGGVLVRHPLPGPARLSGFPAIRAGERRGAGL